MVQRLPLEHAVVPDSRLHVVPLEIGTKPGAEIVRGRGLTDGADVVALAFGREQHRALDRPRLGRFAPPFELAKRQRAFVKDQANAERS